MAFRRSSALRSLMLAAALLLVATPMVLGGAVFEIREAIPTKDSDLKFIFNDLAETPGIGSILRSGTEGAGAVFASSILPLTVFTLNKCTAVAPHIHPNGAETVYVLKGKVRVSQFRGEGDMSPVRQVEASEGEAVYIQQGSFHFVENINKGTSQFLQTFDHPQAGAVFAASALISLPRNIVNSAFNQDVFENNDKALGTLIAIRDCHFDH